MPKKARVTKVMDSQYVKRFETLLKFTREYFCDISWSLPKRVSSKNSVLVVSEILRWFVGILTPDDEYSLSVKATI